MFINTIVCFADGCPVLVSSFKMFHSPEPTADLIFSDAAQQLRPVPEEERSHTEYLGQSRTVLHRVMCIDPG